MRARITTIVLAALVAAVGCHGNAEVEEAGWKVGPGTDPHDHWNVGGAEPAEHSDDGGHEAPHTEPGAATPGTSGGSGGGCDLSVHLIDANTHHPSNVVVFFSVESCLGQGVAGLDASSFVLAEDGKPFSSFESNHVLLSEQQPHHLWVQLVLDTSGSIVKSGELHQLEQAVAAYASASAAGQSTAIHLFDGRAKLHELLPFTSDKHVLSEAASSIGDAVQTAIDEGVYDESTNLYGAVVEATEKLEFQLADAPPDELWEGAVVVFTDGTDHAGWVSEAHAVEAVSGSPVRVYVIGLGGETDDTVLSTIGKDGYFQATEPSELVASFEAASAEIAAAAGKFYTLSYCSPARKGEHEVEVRVESGPWIGTLEYTFDATGFTGGCDPLEGSL